MNHWWSDVDKTLLIWLAIAGMNIVLTALHHFFFWLYEKKKWHWSETTLSAISFLLEMIAWVSANKRHPDFSPEVQKHENPK